MQLAKLRNSSFLKHNAVFFFGSLVVGVLNYAFYPVIGRLLPVSAYGEVQALVSLFLQLGIFLTVLSQVTVNVVANYDDPIQKQRVTLELERLGFLVGLAILLVGSVFSHALASFFHFNSVWPFIVMLVAVVATVPLSFRTGYLKGHRKFSAVALANITSSASEIIISAVLVILGFGATGALGGLVIAQILAFSYAAYRARQVGFTKPEGTRLLSLPEWNVIAPEMKYSVFVLILSIMITGLSTLDIFTVKHYFDPKVAGYYAGVSIIGRSIYFVTVPISQVMLPMVRLNRTARENRAVLLKSLGLLTLIGGGAALVFSLFPRLIIGILMGHRYLAYAHLLPMLSLVMFMVSVINLFVSYYISLRKYHSSVIIAISALITGLLIVLRHQTVGTVVSDLVYSTAATLALFIVWELAQVIGTKQPHAES